MVTKEPLILDTTKPPIMAVIMPPIGGKPDAIAIPRHNGKAIRNTKKPDSKSLRQFSTKPGRPVLGKQRGDELDMDYLVQHRKNQIHAEFMPDLSKP
jgi:hypothetical protein